MAQEISTAVCLRSSDGELGRWDGFSFSWVLRLGTTL